MNQTIRNSFCFLFTSFLLITPTAVYAVEQGNDGLDTVDVFKIYPEEDLGLVVGSSALKRTKRGVKISIDTSMLDPATTYTVWAAIFNYPKYCVDDCNDADLLGIEPGADARVQASLMYLTGRVTPGDSDAANFVGSIKKGAAGLTNRELLIGPGLLNPEGAEIHVVIRCHGDPLFPDLTAVAAQISTFAGGCDVNECVDVQVGLHFP